MTSHNKDNHAEQLLQLSQEVSRIAGTLARLTVGSAVSEPPARATGESDMPEVSEEAIRSITRARRMRARYFRANLFADPAWDMMLELLEAEIAQRRVAVSSLCLAADVPATTALRWIKTMVDEGLFIRHADPRDARRIFVELAPETSRLLRRYFAEARPGAGS